jgi:hypothetical protein
MERHAMARCAKYCGALCPLDKKILPPKKADRQRYSGGRVNTPPTGNNVRVQQAAHKFL